METNKSLSANENNSGGNASYNSAVAEDKIESLNDFTEHIIHGIGGLDDYINYEIPVYDDEKLFIADWVIRCLANTDCKGSELIINEIIKKRTTDKAKKQATASL